VCPDYGIRLDQWVPPELGQQDVGDLTYMKISMRSNLRILGVAGSLFFFILGNPAHLAAVDFAAATSYPVGTSPAAVAVGDFNGDGKPDIAVANTGSGNVSILLGNGDGTFQVAVNFSSGNNPTKVALGDFNADGKLDLALFQPGDTLVSRAGSVSILLGNGDGTFQAPKTLALSENALVVGVADFNLDNKSDIAVGDTNPNSALGTLNVFIGNGDGTFQPAKQTPFPTNSGGFVTADFNGDLKPDVAVISQNGIQILLGNGDGTFSTGVTVHVTYTGLSSPDYESVATADLNHDGKVDLVVGSRVIQGCGPIPPCTTTFTRISAFLGNGDGSFQGEQVAANGVSSFLAGAIPRGSEIDRPFVGDFNGDGKLDLAYRLKSVEFNSTSIQIRLGKGDGTFSSPVTSGLLNVTPFANSIAVAQDLNADKLTDLIALVGTANDIDVLLNTSPTSGADLAIVSSGASPDPVGVGTSLTYSAHALNQGPNEATGVNFKDTLPNAVSFVSATASLGSCVQSSGIVSCNIGALASPFDFTVNIVVTPTAAGTLSNSMDVTANETDPNTANNAAAQTTTALPIFKLAVTKTGNGSGSVTTADGGISCGATCSAPYLSGTVVNVGETPDANSVFAGWSGACTGTGACAVTMSADLTVTANFVLGEKLSVALAGSGSGSVTSKDGAISCTNSGGNCSSLYLPGTSVSLTAAPAAPSVFGGWSGACSGSDPNTCTVTMNSVQSVTATFNPPPPDFTLTPASTTFTTQTGAQVTDLLTLTGQNGFSGPVTLTCAVTGPAPMATCSVSPSPVALGSNPGTSTLTITAPATLAAIALPLDDSHDTAKALGLLFVSRLPAWWNWSGLTEIQEAIRPLVATGRQRHRLVCRTRWLRQREQHIATNASELHGDGQRNVWIVTPFNDSESHRSIVR
jgi:uncharacterized repeat protein (TIGR01451 family)